MGEQTRLEELEKLARSFRFSSTLRPGHVSEEDVQCALDFFEKAVRATRPKVWSSYFDHILSALGLGTRLGTFLNDLGFEIDVNLVRFNLINHDVGRLVYPGDYFRNDSLAQEIYGLMGLDEPLLSHLPSIQEILDVSGSLGFTNKQVGGEEALTKEQLDAIWAYWDSHSLTHHVISVADNLGKDGIRTPEQLFAHLRTLHGTRADGAEATEVTPVQAGTFFQAHVVALTLRFLRTLGLDFESLRSELSDQGAKFYLVCAHNPGRVSTMRTISIGSLLKAWTQLRFEITEIYRDTGVHKQESQLIKDATEARILLGLPNKPKIGVRETLVMLLGEPYAQNFLIYFGYQVSQPGWSCVVFVLYPDESVFVSYELPLDAIPNPVLIN